MISKLQKRNGEMEDKRKLLGITSKKEENFSDWYVQVINKAELIEYTEVSGCYVLRPNSYQIWKQIQNFVSKDLEEMGIEDAYFPLFIPEKQLTAEKDHIEGFALEVAWVTHSGDTPLNEKLAVRPTSETVMYPIYSKWIRSYRDLPLRLNQWCNVVRWEFKNCVPFLRSREFLWQEGHTVHRRKEEADQEVSDILELYRATYEDLLAVPVIKGVKTEKEKFAGALYTTTCEAFIPTSGKAIQAATSHCLGQNFAKMFNITYENEDGKSELPWQNSWGITTRSIGIMIMTHGDNKGLILPPKVAPIQVVVIPIYKKGNDNDRIKQYCLDLSENLKTYGIRCRYDNRENHNPGFLFSEWEMKGVPFQFRIGMKEVEEQTIYVVRRDGLKYCIDSSDIIIFSREIQKFHESLLVKARHELKSHTVEATNWEDFVEELDDGNIVLAPWCENKECEEDIKTRSMVDGKKEGSAKSLCIPYSQPHLEEGTKCVKCDSPAKTWCLFGRSY